MDKNQPFFFLYIFNTQQITNNPNMQQNIDPMMDTVANPMMYESYDNFLQHLWQKAEQLEAVRQDLQKKLDIEVQKLVKCEQAVKVLEKHKEKNKKIYWIC